jgi:hypothetical protein
MHHSKEDATDALVPGSLLHALTSGPRNPGKKSAPTARSADPVRNGAAETIAQLSSGKAGKAQERMVFGTVTPRPGAKFWQLTASVMI